MKRILTSSLTAALLCLTACNSHGNRSSSDADSSSIAQQEQVAAIAERDQLLELVNEINQGMEQIKQLEGILTISNSAPSESTADRQQIQSDIAAIQKALQDRRERLDQLEKKLAGSNAANANLRQTINTLRSQIDSQTEEIATLKQNLGEARELIGHLDAKVDSLNATVTTVTDERNIAQQENVELANEMNTCYYAIGSKSELKDRHIIETGFLRKTKLLKGDFDQGFFTVADRRTLSRIALHSRRAEVLTNQPEGSYIIEDNNGQKVLVITNPDAFWSLSNYLVVKID